MMTSLTLEQLFAVLLEIVGAPVFWSLIGASSLILIAFIALLMRNRKQERHAPWRVKLWASIGALAAILSLQYATSSGFSDLGGPIDLIVLMLAGGAGAVCLMILAYVAQSLLPSKG
ncbi:hypothetical protein CCR95_24795 [Thiocystis minor]|uniref:DUF5368 family protein n=1 Tax=Thiocystis minor TaxID=61597 RepID=UPI0019143FAD|nr:DUF5368 family protein [Thiocystis minor]MBK5967199.1 hypothetical protein [Thiocystis minor]